jgi:hypothetical protein
MTFYKRERWRAGSDKCSDRFTKADVVGVAIHWVGSDLDDSLERGVPDRVAEWLRYRQIANRADGYCDIEYNLAVTSRGDVWEARGLTFDGGANGDVPSNDAYVSILVIVPIGASLTDGHVTGVRKAIKKVRERYPNAKRIRPHSDFRPTACPGPAVVKAIESGDFEPSQQRLRSMIRQVRARLARLLDRLW